MRLRSISLINLQVLVAGKSGESDQSAPGSEAKFVTQQRAERHVARRRSATTGQLAPGGSSRRWMKVQRQVTHDPNDGNIIVALGPNIGAPEDRFFRSHRKKDL